MRFRPELALLRSLASMPIASDTTFRPFLMRYSTCWTVGCTVSRRAISFLRPSRVWPCWRESQCGVLPSHSSMRPRLRPMSEVAAPKKLAASCCSRKQKSFPYLASGEGGG